MVINAHTNVHTLNTSTHHTHMRLHFAFNQCHTTTVDVRVVEEGQNIYTLVPDNDLPRRGVIKINAESHELTFSDNPFDKNEGVMFETSPCQNGDCLELTLIDSDVHGKLHVRSEDNALVVKERKSSGFRIIP